MDVLILSKQIRYFVFSCIFLLYPRPEHGPIDLHLDPLRVFMEKLSHSPLSHVFFLCWQRWRLCLLPSMLKGIKRPLCRRSQCIIEYQSDHSMDFLVLSKHNSLCFRSESLHKRNTPFLSGSFFLILFRFNNKHTQNNSSSKRSRK